MTNATTNPEIICAETVNADVTEYSVRLDGKDYGSMYQKNNMWSYDLDALNGKTSIVRVFDNPLDAANDTIRITNKLNDVFHFMV